MKYNNKSYNINISGKILDLKTPALLGILNVTPDSFFDGGLYQNLNAVLKRAEQIINEGAEMIDIGGYSSRPNAEDISIEEEKKRVLPAIEAILKEFPEAIISIDTFRSEVALAAVNTGAKIINDVSGGNLDSQMFEVVSMLKVPYIMMHMRGTPQTMTQLNQYNDLIIDIYQELQAKVKKLRDLGVADIIIDLGFGFAKNIRQNFFLLNHLDYFQKLDLPILVGVSRKSMIHKTLGIDSADALNGTTALNTVALLKGANMLRVHDVKAARETIKLYLALTADI
jgi:dihydropteroate synthase